jgi:hypothetical protein
MVHGWSRRGVPAAPATGAAGDRCSDGSIQPGQCPHDLVGDQEPVGALGASGAHEPFGRAVRPRRARCRLDDLHALAAEDCLEGCRERGVPISDQKPERPNPQIHGQVAGGLGDPRPSGRSGDTENVHPGGCGVARSAQRWPGPPESLAAGVPGGSGDIPTVGCPVRAGARAGVAAR